MRPRHCANGRVDRWSGRNAIDVDRALARVDDTDVVDAAFAAGYADAARRRGGGLRNADVVAPLTGD